ncbi:MAG: LemA family protein [Chloroflexi bacterium]|nr:LemA family protein [Chloroflexota bacterium]
MSAGIIAIIVVVALVVLAGLFFLLTYNALVRDRLRCREAWSGIDVQLKRRSSLVPNLVETVKGYAKHEREVFENVTRARAALMGAQTPQQAAEANNLLTATLKTLFAVAEAYPELKANQNFQQLQAELSDLEAKIAYARQFYNGNVLSYNTRLQTVPSAFVANLFSFKEEGFFAATEAERADVKVSFAS